MLYYMEPLAHTIRPKSLADFIGQEHLVGPGKPISTAIEQKHLFSFILWGPPGVGKTTLARIYAQSLGAKFYELSAVSAGKEDIRRIVEEQNLLDGSKPKVLFLDEIHRFNKAQQDFLLPFVESGQITLIGATTENPSFEVISALLSRCQVFILKSLDEAAMQMIFDRIQKVAKIKLDKLARKWLIDISGGDARSAIKAIDNTYTLYEKVTVPYLEETIQQAHLRFDKKGDEHYDTISAFIKSMRASQPDAALYYLARMVEAGQDPKFIARRMVIFASEDIGMAQPTALVVANEVFKAVELIGYPECSINLAHGVVYLATAKKDRSSYEAYGRAVDEVRKSGNLPIPLKIRNAPTKLMKDVGYGKGYKKYTDESYLPDKIKGKRFLI